MYGEKGLCDTPNLSNDLPPFKNNLLKANALVAYHNISQALNPWRALFPEKMMGIYVGPMYIKDV